MATPKWQPGHLYPPGSLVVPRTAAAPVDATITNAGFESGDATGWTLGAGMDVQSSKKYTGSYSARFTGTAGAVRIVHDAVDVVPGKSITASCMYQQGAASAGHNTGCVLLQWFDAGDTLIREDKGSLITSSSGGWKMSTVTGSGPANAAKVAIGCLSNRDGSDASYCDEFKWNYADAAPPTGLVYRAVQPETGYSDTTEPAWPPTTGVQVTDNEVIWEGVLASRVVWEASPILLSGDTEPEWPLDVGEYVADNTVSWQTVSRRVEDPNCPNSKVVAIMASKVFAVDKDITRYCATLNAYDWTSEEDAGFLGTGLQQANANDMAVLAPYRANLAAMNASSFQNWQPDPDPALMALLDQMEGIGSTWQHAAHPVGDDLYYLSQLGIRSVGIAAGTSNLSAGDVGMPIDPLVRPAIAAAVAAGSRPVSTYYPSQGQYWLAFPDYPEVGQSEVFVGTRHSGGKPKWSRYNFPFAIEAFAQLGNDLYIRNGDQVSIVDETLLSDELEDGSTVEFPGLVWSPYLDCGQSGVTKMLEAFDIVATGEPSVSFGYDDGNLAMFTDPYAVPADTLRGDVIPMPVSAPTISVRIDFAPGARWSLSSMMLYLSDFRVRT